MLVAGRTRRLLIAAVTVAFGCAIFAGAAASPIAERAQAVTDCSLTVPANIVGSTDPNQATRVVNYPAPVATGTCNTITCSPASGGAYAIGTTMVTCSASTSPVVRGSFTIRVIDQQPPAIGVPADRTVSNDPGAASAAVSFPAPIASDNAPGVTGLCDHKSGSLFPVGTTTVTCTARDTSENVTSATFRVTVNDTEAPETLITSGPAGKTATKRAKFEFVAFASASKFECSLDSAAFETCSTPAKYKLGKGKHNFRVRAVDSAGNADVTPAARSWKVKKPKR